MIIRENYLGKIAITDEYIKEVISKTVSECFGVSGMCCVNFREFMISKLLGNKNYPVGINVKTKDNSVKIQLHISAAYGTNIAAVVASVKHKVRFVLTETVGVEVDAISIFVDEIKI